MINREKHLQFPWIKLGFSYFPAADIWFPSEVFAATVISGEAAEMMLQRGTRSATATEDINWCLSS